MPFGLTRHTATRLANGKVLVTGGLTTGTSLDNPSDEALLYDPASGSFTVTGSMSIPRFRHTATLLPNGKVLIAGGVTTGSGGVCTNTAELYDPAANNGAGAFVSTGAMAQFRSDYTATLLPNGKVLVAAAAGRTVGRAVRSRREQRRRRIRRHRFDERAARRPHGQPPRERHGAHRRRGRYDPPDGAGRGQIFDPAALGGTGGFSTRGTMLNPRYGHRATLLPSGRVLMTGGLDFTLNPFAPAGISMRSRERSSPPDRWRPRATTIRRLAWRTGGS